jgi:hypothetical protein
MIFTDMRRGRAFAKDPSVIYFQNRYLMYYTQGPKQNTTDANLGEGFAIGIAESFDLDHWEIVGDILPVDLVEKKGLCAPSAIVMGEKVQLFYQTYGNGKSDALCHAESLDGLHFTRHPQNPIIKPTGSWNCGRAIDADALVFKNKLFIYWATRDPEMKIQQLGVHTTSLDSNFDPQTWVQENLSGPILKPELPWEGSCIEAPATCVHAGKVWMWYGGAYNAEPQQIGSAVSEDGVVFQRLSKEPWLPCGKPGSWNQHESGHPFVFTDPVSGDEHLFYQGTGDKGQTWWLSRRKIKWVDHLPQLV